ncbi:MAG TPA: glycosyltransferase [Vicinamibacterales bacterium]|nr:glycosyltransferase [Vicinamibacterales bacterium]
MRHVVVMVTTSYPRFPGDAIGTFMEPIAKGIAARGHEVHLVAPWHPRLTRGKTEDGVFLHFFRYAPVPSLNVFGYAEGLRGDVRLRGAAWMAAPFAIAAGWFEAMRVAQKRRATMMHAHWVVPGGVIAAAARPSLPLVVSLHGSDVFVAEHTPAAGVAARRVFRRAGFVTACSQDLADRAVRLGASSGRIAVVPYGVDVARFRPEPGVRAAMRATIGLPAGATVIAAAGRLVSKKGFEYLIDAIPMVAAPDAPHLVLAGSGDLDAPLRARASASGAVDRIHFVGNLSQDAVGRWFAAADVAVVPSVRDDSGNVDGLPNTLLEALAAGAAVVTTGAGGISRAVEPGRTATIVPERDATALAAAIGTLLRDSARRTAMGEAGRAVVQTGFGWDAVALQFEQAYERALAFKSLTR